MAYLRHSPNWQLRPAPFEDLLEVSMPDGNLFARLTTALRTRWPLHGFMAHVPCWNYNAIWYVALIHTSENGSFGFCRSARTYFLQRFPAADAKERWRTEIQQSGKAQDHNKHLLFSTDPALCGSGSSAAGPPCPSSVASVRLETLGNRRHVLSRGAEIISLRLRVCRCLLCVRSCITVGSDICICMCLCTCICLYPCQCLCLRLCICMRICACM